MFRLLNVVPCAALSVALVLPQLPLQQHDTPLPLIVWHGLGDNYENEGLRSVGDFAEEVNPGTYTYFVHLANSGSEDRKASYFGNVTAQVDEVCTAVAKDPILSLAPAVNGIGFSQGGQFLRGWVERCNNPPMANLVTFGAQHNGIARYESCEPGDWLCNTADGLLKGSTWTSFAQSTLVPAQYFRDPEDLDSYLMNSNYLADINNERSASRSTLYRENMKTLENFVMYVFSEDKAVVPKVSGWFSEYNATSEKETKLQDRQLYKEDWLGLKWLDERGRLAFKETPGRHMNITDELLRSVFEGYFAPKSTGKSQE